MVNRPSGSKKLAADRAPCFTAFGEVMAAFETCGAAKGRIQHGGKPFSFLFFLFLLSFFLSLVLEFLEVLVRDKGCPRLIQVG